MIIAYSWYGVIEWSMILTDVGFDATFAFELSQLKIAIGCVPILKKS
jgi:hypothetical protein